jgi:hypothetical protein
LPNSIHFVRAFITILTKSTTEKYGGCFEVIEEIIDGGSLGEFESILLGPGFSCLFVVLPLSSGFVIKRIVGVGFGKKTLDGKEN